MLNNKVIVFECKKEEIPLEIPRVLDFSQKHP